MHFNNLFVVKRKLVVMAIGRLIALSMILGVAYISTPLGSPGALPQTRPALWMLFGVALLVAGLLVVSSFCWLRRQLLIIKITQLIHDKTNGRDVLTLQLPDGNEACASVFLGSVALWINTGLQKTSYTVTSSSIYGVRFTDDILMDSSNGADSEVMQWTRSTKMERIDLSERELAIKLRSIIAD